MATMSGDPVDEKEKERKDIDKLFKKVSRFFYIPGYSADVVDFPSDEDSSSKSERDKQTESPERDISSDVPGEIDSGEKKKSESEKQTDKLFRRVSHYFYIPGYSADVVDFPSDEGSSSESEEKKQTESPATDISRDDPRRNRSRKTPPAGSDFKAYSKSLHGPGPVDIDELKVSFKERGKKPKLVFDLRRKSQYQHGDVSHGDADKTIESSSVSSMERVNSSELELDEVVESAGMGVLATGEVVICDYRRLCVIYSFSSNGAYISSTTTITDMPGIHDVAGTPDGGMVAVSRNTLYRLNKQWKELWRMDTKKLGDRIHGGVCVDRQGVIYIRLYHSVCVVGDDGTILRHIHHHVPRAEYDWPWSFSGIAVQPWGDILLPDPHNHCIVVLSASGEPKGELEGPLHLPCGVAVDADGTVAVTDYGTDTVTVYTPRGHCIESWGKYGTEPGEFKGPAGIAFSPSGDLIVCDSENHRVQIF